MKKIISESELNNIIKEATKSVLREGGINSMYALNNLTWARANNTDDNSAALTDNAKAVRIYLANKYPKLKEGTLSNSFNTSCCGFNINEVFKAMKESERVSNQDSGDADKDKKARIMQLQKQLGVVQNGIIDDETKAAAQKQGVTIEPDLLSESWWRPFDWFGASDWHNNGVSADEDLNKSEMVELQQDFSMLLDVCVRRSGVFRNWGNDHSLDSAAKEQICSYLNIRYIPSKYADSSSESPETGTEGNEDTTKSKDGATNVDAILKEIMATGLVPKNYANWYRILFQAIKDNQPQVKGWTFDKLNNYKKAINDAYKARMAAQQQQQQQQEQKQQEDAEVQAQRITTDAENKALNFGVVQNKPIVSASGPGGIDTSKAPVMGEEILRSKIRKMIKEELKRNKK